MVSPLDLLEYREEAERTRKELAECSVALEDIGSLGDNRVPFFPDVPNHFHPYNPVKLKFAFFAKY